MVRQVPGGHIRADRGRMRGMKDREAFKHIPSVDLLLRDVSESGLDRGHPRPLVVRALRRALNRVRDDLGSGSGGGRSAEEVRALAFRESERELERLALRSLRPVINATGVVVHTNLGRAPLSARALERIGDAARGYSNLEYDLETGARGTRGELVAEALCELTGAEAALVVNNNAAAVLLALNTFAMGREVIISRGELIEIGGSFRLPEVFERSGARMVAVGTTNRTHSTDFERAISNRTAALMSAHWSNYSISGFVDRVGVRDLAAMAGRAGLPLLHDLGSGIIGCAEAIGLEGEMTLADSVAAGATVVTASGDKILGGPQAGIVVGAEDAVKRMASNPLMRALRPGKLTLGALQATLEAYLEGRAASEVPVQLMLAGGLDELRDRAARIAAGLSEVAGCETEVVDTVARVGGGSAPGTDVPSVGLSLRPVRMSAESLATRLRGGATPVIVRTAEDRVLLDMRTVLPENDETLTRAVRSALEHQP